MDKNKMAAVLYEIAAILFIITAIAGKSWVFIPVGLCFAVIGFITYKKDK